MLYFYAKPLTQEYCFTTDQIPENVEVGQIRFNLEQLPVAGVLVDVRNAKEARRVGSGLIQNKIAEIKKEEEKRRRGIK